MSSKAYSGSCQCGEVRFEAKADLDNTTTCNCSRCRRTGIVMTFVPTSDFKLVAGDGEMTEYRFNKHVIEHRFCSTCGIQSFARAQMPDGTPMIAINARCLDGVDVDALPPSKKFDGASK